MPSQRQATPYEVLRLPAAASVEQVVERSKELSSETVDRDEQAAYRRAAEETRRHPVRRARHQFWEPPGARYGDDLLDDFCRRHRAAPQAAAALEERKQRFVEHDCSARALAFLALPPLVPPRWAARLEVRHVPHEEQELTLEPWELFA